MPTADEPPEGHADQPLEAGDVLKLLADLREHRYWWIFCLGKPYEDHMHNALTTLANLTFGPEGKTPIEYTLVTIPPGTFVPGWERDAWLYLIRHDQVSETAFARAVLDHIGTALQPGSNGVLVEARPEEVQAFLSVWGTGPAMG
jgi:hypothetical protein